MRHKCRCKWHSSRPSTAQMAQQQAQQSIQQQQQIAQQANDDGRLPPARTPKFSVKAGQYPGLMTVKIEARSRGSAIYYTTDGWTPTQASNLYRAPVRITQSTTLQAIAVSPYYSRSMVKSEVYMLPASPAVPEPATTVSSSLLHKGTAVPLIFCRAYDIERCEDRRSSAGGPGRRSESGWCGHGRQRSAGGGQRLSGRQG